MKHPRPRAIDLFCGAGGSSYGARAAGCEIVAGFDIWEPAARTFQVNFPRARVFEDDIAHISAPEVRESIGDIDLILASPECTSHSRAKGKAERSEESRQSAFQVIKFARAFLPRWIVIENVVEMRTWDSYEKLLEDIKNLGYWINDIVLNAKDYGVPQSRQRLFLLCSRLGPPEKPAPVPGAVQGANSIIHENSYKFTPLQKEGRAAATLARAEQAIKTLGNEQPFLIVYYGSGKTGNGGWQRVTEPLRTITTLDRFAYVVPGSEGEGHKMRMLQPEELKLAMGYGPDFVLDQIEGLSRRDRVKLMGNGVCPPVMRAIVESLLKETLQANSP